MKISPSRSLSLTILVAGGVLVDRCHGQKCPQYGTCLDCLRDPHCGSWYEGAGCYSRCMIADIPCYFANPSITSPEAPAHACARADKDRADADACAAAPKNCAGCTATRLPGGDGNCAWFDRVKGREYCGKPGCTMMGCGDADPKNCPVEPTPTVPTPSPEEDNDNRVDDADCSSYGDCLGCLSDPACGSWYQGRGCFDRCIIADIPCYRSRTSSSSAQQVCARADAGEANENLCKQKSDCASCTSTALTGGSGTCAWYGRVQGREHCGKPGCTMMGCGESDPAKCPANVNANEEESESVSGEKNCTSLHGDCLGCLDDPDCGSWAPGGGCYANCTDAGDLPCYMDRRNDNETTADVCARAANIDITNEDTIDGRAGEKYEHEILPGVSVPGGKRPEKKQKSKEKKQKGVRGGK